MTTSRSPLPNTFSLCFCLQKACTMVYCDDIRRRALFLLSGHGVNSETYRLIEEGLGVPHSRWWTCFRDDGQKERKHTRQTDKIGEHFSPSIWLSCVFGWRIWRVTSSLEVVNTATITTVTTTPRTDLEAVSLPLLFLVTSIIMIMAAVTRASSSWQQWPRASSQRTTPRTDLKVFESPTLDWSTEVSCCCYH